MLLSVMPYVRLELNPVYVLHHFSCVHKEYIDSWKCHLKYLDEMYIGMTKCRKTGRKSLLVIIQTRIQLSNNLFCWYFIEKKQYLH